jgi:hypothetical protein
MSRKPPEKHVFPVLCLQSPSGRVGQCTGLKYQQSRFDSSGGGQYVALVKKPKTLGCNPRGPGANPGGDSILLRCRRGLDSRMQRIDLQSLKAIKHRGRYLRVRVVGYPSANRDGYMLLHRLVMEQHLGRYLDAQEVIHHRDGDPSNNAISNLEVLQNVATHSKLHAKEPETLQLTCPECERVFEGYAGRTTCSYKCARSRNEKGDWPTDEELGQLLWEKPAVQVARDIGVSDVAIAKRCKRRQIDKPPRGYWAKQK